MKRQLRHFIALSLILVSSSVFALETSSLLTDHPSAALLEKNCIRTDVCGVLPIHFKKASNFLSQADLVQCIQTEYRRSIHAADQYEVPITETDPGTYRYTTEKKQRTTIKELCRKQTSTTTFDLIYHAQGKRYFGKYDVLIHIQLIDAKMAGTVYVAEIHAYPRGFIRRFFIRKLGRIEHYFQNKTRMINRVATHICNNLDGFTPFIPANTTRCSQERNIDARPNIR